MKTIAFKLSALVLIAIMQFVPGKILAQEFTRDVKLTRKEKKEARLAELKANYLAIDTLLERKQFILEADYLQGRYGNQVPVTSNLNFIRVDKTDVVLQTGANASFGYNGVGGITAEGSITNYKISKDPKKLNFVVTLTTVTNIGTYDVIFRIGADANAQATITGLTSGSLTYRGNLLALYNSRVFKGQRTL